MKNRFTLLLLVIIEVTALLLFFILTDISPYVRGGFGWRWPFAPVPLGKALALFGVLGAYAGGAYVLVHRVRQTAPVLAWAFLGAVLIPGAVIGLRHDDVIFELLSRTLSSLTTGPHHAAAELDWSTDPLRRWPAVMASFVGRNNHMSTSPPGAILFYAMLNALFRELPGVAGQLQQALLPYFCDNPMLLQYAPEEWASALFGTLMPLWAALAVFPLYSSTRRLSTPEQGRWAAIWWPLVPAVSLFAASPNTFYPLLTLLAFDLITRWCCSEHGAYRFGLAGLITGLGTFAYAAFAPVPVMLGLYVVLDLVRKYGWNLLRVLRAGLPLAAWLVAGFGLPWLIFWLASDLTPLDILAASMTQHIPLERPYLPWVWLHLQDWVLFTGVPLIALWLAGTFHPAKEPEARAIGNVGLVMLIAILIIDLSGISRGETGRVWLLYTPFVLIAAADGLHRLAGERRQAAAWGVIAACQVALLVAPAAMWDTMISDLGPPPTPPGSLQATQPADAHFGDLFTLTGWDATAEDGAIVLRLDWQAARRTTTPYTFSATLVGPDGIPTPEVITWQPLDARYPTTCWAPGEQVGDAIRLPLPEDAAPGEWRIRLTAFADDTPEEPLPVTTADGRQAAELELGPVTIR
ncbi:MAG: hypothetical protein HPY64_14995 [Anaerolineae bacterium]|nr:hypothetical protein [Anaerolineae bacterium]